MDIQHWIGLIMAGFFAVIFAVIIVLLAIGPFFVVKK